MLLVEEVIGSAILALRPLSDHSIRGCGGCCALSIDSGTMLDTLLDRLTTAILDRPRIVVAAAVILALGAGWLRTGLEFSTSRRALVPDGDVNQILWDRVRADFKDPEPLILAIERTSNAVPSAAAEQAAEQIAAQLLADPAVGSVFYRVDVDWIRRHALFLAPPDQLRAAVRQLDDLLGPSSDLLEVRGFADLNALLAARIEESLTRRDSIDAANAGAETALLGEFLEAQRDFLEAPVEWTERLPRHVMDLLASEQSGAITDNGFLATEDGMVLFVLVHPAGTGNGGLELANALVTATRAAAEEVGSQIDGLRFGLTGPPAMEVEEMAAVGRDGVRTSVIAMLGVFILSLFAFHRRVHAMFGLAALALGVLGAIGAVWLQYGYLNLITTSLIPILVGMGIDYAVHPISQYEIERRQRGRIDAVRHMLRKTGRPVAISALTTSAAFFCFALMRFKGFAELGLVTGVGVLLCLAAALVALPAMLALGGRGHREQRDAMVDRVWDEGAARLVCTRPRVVLLGALAVTAAAVPALWQIEVNTSLLEMLPADAESTRYLNLMSERSALRNDFNLVVAESVEDPRALESRVAEHLEIERMDSVLAFLPSEPESSAAAVAEVRVLLDRLRVGTSSAPLAELETSLSRLEEALANAADNAFGAGLGELTGLLEEARLEVEVIKRLVADATPALRDSWNAGDQALQEQARSFLSQLRLATAGVPPAAASLPPELAARFLTQSGAFVGYLYPTGSIYDEEFLPRFNNASRSVDENAIGFPVIFEDHSNLITAGFGAALGAGAFLVALILLADFRRLIDPALALVPVLLGLLWLLGMTRWFGIDLNFANLIAIPIVLGVGIDAGVHVVHRFRLESGDGMVVALAHTGRAILVASLTTMVGFGSLMFASHRGMASLGALLFLGVGACLVAAVIVLPNLLLALGLARR